MCTCAAHVPRPRRRLRRRPTARGVLRRGVAVLPRVVPPRGRDRETVLRRVARGPRVAHARAPRDLRRPLRDHRRRRPRGAVPQPLVPAAGRHRLLAGHLDARRAPPRPLLRLPAAALRHDRPRLVLHGHARPRDGRLPVGRGRRHQRPRPRRRDRVRRPLGRRHGLRHRSRRALRPRGRARRRRGCRDPVARPGLDVLQRRAHRHPSADPRSSRSLPTSPRS